MRGRLRVVKATRQRLPDGPLAIMLSGCRWTSSGGAQRPVALAREFARRGYGVIYYNAAHIGCSLDDNIMLIDRARMRRLLPHIAEQRSGFVVNGLPTETYHGMAQTLQRSGYTYVYDCIDDWPAFYARGDLWEYCPRLEKRIARQCDVLTASATVLQQRCERDGRKQCVLIRNGGPAEPRYAANNGRALLTGAGGTAVYIGYLRGSWFDWPLLYNTARRMPDIAFNLVGNISSRERQRVERHYNIHAHGELAYDECMGLMAAADIGIVPFRDEAICAAVDPIKLYDHWAAGQPVAATAVMTEMAGRPYVHMAAPAQRRMTAAIRAALAQGRIPQTEVRRLCAQNSWAMRAEQMLIEVDSAASNSEAHGGHGRTNPRSCVANRPQNAWRARR